MKTAPEKGVPQKQTSIKARHIFNKGVHAEKNGDLRYAMAAYKAAIREDAAFREAYINLGTLLSRARKFRLALMSFRKARDLKEDHVILFNLGVLFFRIRRFPSARIMFERTLERKKDFTRATLLLGFTLNQLGQTDKARDCFERILRDEPNHPQALLAITYTLYFQRDYRPARRYLDRLLKLDPQRKELSAIRAKLGLVSDGKGSFDTDTWKEVLKTEKGFAEFNRYLQKVQRSPDPKQRAFHDELEAHIDYAKKNLTNESDSREWLDTSLAMLFKGNVLGAMKALHKANVALEKQTTG